MKVNKPWELAMQDPHLMRLGDYLAHLEGEEEMMKLESQGISKWSLEEQFLAEPWKAGQRIIKVVDPQLVAKPFILLWNSQTQDHTGCALYKMAEGGVKEQCREKTTHLSKIPGLCNVDNKDAKAEERKENIEQKRTEKEKQRSFKPWEKHEKGGNLQGIFNWKQHRNCKDREDREHCNEQDSNSGSEKKKIKSKAGPVDVQCKEKITRPVLKLLLSTYSFRTKMSSKTGKSEKSKKSGKVFSSSSRSAPSEVPQARKSRLGFTSKKKKRLASTISMEELQVI